MPEIFYDFEAYCDNTYSQSNGFAIPQFIRDPRFQIMSVSTVVDGQASIYPGDDQDWLNELKHLDEQGYRFVSHNSLFDLRILYLRYGFTPRLLGDTRAVARYFSFGRKKHGLDSLSQHLLGEGVTGEPVPGRYLRDIPHAQWRHNALCNARRTYLTWRLWDVLVPELPERELDLIDHTLQLAASPIRISMERYRKDREMLSARIKAFEVKNPQVTEIVNRPDDLKRHIKNEFGESLPTVDKKNLKAHALPEPVKGFMFSVWAYKEDVKTQRDLLSLISRMGTDDGTSILVDLHANGCHSHRWTSGGSDVTGQRVRSFDFLTLTGCTREVLIPDESQVFVVADLSQIEPRIVSWLAGEMGLLEAFRAGDDVYEAFGRHLFGRKVDPDGRHLCKEAVLGLNYGMGAPRFSSVLMQKAPDALDNFMAQLGITDAETAARMIRDKYRKAYPRVAAMCGSCSDAFTEVACGRAQSLAIGDQELMFESQPDGQTVRTVLPTGGFLLYQGIETSMQENRFRPGETETVVSYCGGTVSYSMPLENAVQAMARDILGRIILRLEEEGLRVVLHIHDEVVVTVPKIEAHEALELVKFVMREEHPALPGLPIDCKAYLSDRFTKDEEYMEAYTEKEQKHAR